MSQRSYIELRFAPHRDLIDSTREFVLRFLTHALRDQNIASQISMAAHELMENAVKYSVDDGTKLRIDVDSDGSIVLAVENRALPSHVPVLMEEMRTLTSASDAAALYRQKMELALTRHDGKSCLGLSRIRCEAEMTLRHTIEDGVVRMIAERTIPKWTPQDSRSR